MFSYSIIEQKRAEDIRPWWRLKLIMYLKDEHISMFTHNQLYTEEESDETFT